MIELNLLPDIKLQFVHAQRTRRRVIAIASLASLAFVAAVVLLALYVYAVQPVRGLLDDNGIKDANTKLSGVANLNDYLTIQQQLKDLPVLHGSKPIYSRLIGYLPTLNPTAPNNVHITQLTIDSTVDANRVVIQAYAPSYTAATVFQSTLQSAQFSSSAATSAIPLFTSVSLSNTSLGQDSAGNKVVDFTATLQVDPSVFAANAGTTTITVPSKNATGSAQNVPAVFSTAGGGN